MTCEHMLAIPAYPRNTDAGGQPLGALHACLSGIASQGVILGAGRVVRRSLPVRI